jgi:hypothetical protein
VSGRWTAAVDETRLVRRHHPSWHYWMDEMRKTRRCYCHCHCHCHCYPSCDTYFLGSSYRPPCVNVYPTYDSWGSLHSCHYIRYWISCMDVRVARASTWIVHGACKEELLFADLAPAGSQLLALQWFDTTY